MMIHSKKTFMFINPDEPLEKVTVKNEDIVTVPDWVENTLLFKLASTPDKNQHVDITLVAGKQQKIAVENGDLSLAEQNKNGKNTESSTDEK